jgi:hypothetical protein
MKKLFYVIVFTLFVQIVYAQTWGIKGGVSISNINLSGTDWPYSSDSYTGYHIGAIADFVLKEKLHFNTGLLFARRGFLGKGSSEAGLDWSDKMNYLELPLNLAYYFKMSDKADIFLQGGPFLAYALSGTETYEGVSFSIEFPDYWKRLDYGIGVGAGVQLSSFVLGLTYQFGLANLNDDPEWTGAVIKSGEFQISVAYMFTKK